LLDECDDPLRPATLGANQGVSLIDLFNAVGPPSMAEVSCVTAGCWPPPVESARVRGAIQQFIASILGGVDGTLTVEAEPKGLLGVEDRFAQLGCRGSVTHILRTFLIGKS
jgi:hypothetical protein